MTHTFDILFLLFWSLKSFPAIQRTEVSSSYQHSAIPRHPDLPSHSAPSSKQPETPHWHCYKQCPCQSLFPPFKVYIFNLHLRPIGPLGTPSYTPSHLVIYDVISSLDGLCSILRHLLPPSIPIGHNTLLYGATLKHWIGPDCRSVHHDPENPKNQRELYFLPPKMEW